MVLCRTSRVGFQNGTIIEETLTANYIIKESKRSKYLEKFREYKLEYTRRWHKADKNKGNNKYRKRVTDYIEYMKPYNKKLNDDEITKEEYLKVLNKYIEDTSIKKIDN